MGECIFCRIAFKAIPAKIISETSLALAFHDINPQAPLHVLIIPKEHIGSVLEIKAQHSVLLKEMFLMAQDIARQEKVDQSGFRLIFNCGPHAGQAVDHLHLHLLGRRKLSWPPG